MGFFDQIKNSSQSTAQATAPSMQYSGTPRVEIFTFADVPQSLDSLKSLKEAELSSPYMTAALTILALCNYEVNTDVSIEMLNFLKGPQPLSTYEKQFLRDRLVGKGYVARSYFVGTYPENDYMPTEPLQIAIEDGPYSYQDENYVMLYLQSSGADSKRQIKLRRKGDKWFLWENYLLPDIRQPKSSDPWA